jgi:hypothetical protein
MRKLLKQRGLYVLLTAAALVMAALLTSCPSPMGGASSFDGAGGGGAYPFNPPAGMGYIKFNFADSGAKTISTPLPAVGTLYYRVVAVDKAAVNPGYNSDTINSGATVTPTQLTANPLVLLPATYTITVTAYDGVASTDIIGFFENDVVVNASMGATVPIVLKPQTDGSGEGDFDFTIALPANATASGTTTVYLDVKTYPGKAALGTPVSYNLKTTPSDTVTLNSGFYYVTVTFSDSSQALENRTITEILHVYENRTVTWAPTLPALNAYSYEVTYNANGGTGFTTSVFGPFVHGSILTEYTNSPPAVELTHPTGYTFNSWNRGSTTVTPTSAWNFASTKLLGPVTLYAIWNSTKTFALDISLFDPDDPEFDFVAADTLYRDDYYDGIIEDVKIEATNLTGFTIVEWIVPWTPLTPYGTASTITISNDPGDLANYLEPQTPGPHIITVVVRHTASGDYHSLNFTVTFD